METFIHYLPILSFCFGGGCLVSVFGLVLKINRRMRANELGTQALLRDRLYHLYFKYKGLGYRTTHSTENFNNIYAQYHNLGANGVMDDLKEKFLDLELKEEKL